jgi:hypothetical protein
MLHVAMRRTPLALVLLSLLVLGFAIDASALQQPASGRRANARKLLRIADRASQRMIRTGQGRLDREARTRPFWEALHRMDSQIDQVGSGLRTRDLSFFRALRAGTSALAELRTTWALSGVKDPAIDQDLRTLDAAYSRLRNRYGPEWVRFQAGRPLSEDERIRFARMRAEQGYLAGKIEPLRDRAEQARDYATAHELAFLLAQIQGVATASPTLGDYLDASVATDSIRGAWYGARAAHSTEEEGWSEADQVVSDITTDESVGFVFTSDLNAVQDWSFVEEETDVPEEIAQEDLADPGEGDRQIAPGGVVDLGSVEEPEADPQSEETEGIVLTEPIEPIEDTEPVEDVEGITEDQPEDVTEEPAVEEQPAVDEPDTATIVPDEGAIEEEDLEVEEVPPGEAAPPPTTAPVPPPPTTPPPSR